MTVFVPESIKVLGSDAGGASVVLCDMFVDDLADLPAPDAYNGYKLSMGCTATVINDNSRHRINSAGQWVQIAAGTASYTRAEIDSMIARIDATEAEDRAALIAQVDGGAKNLLQLFQLGSSNANVGNPCTSQGVEYEIQSDGTITAYRKSSSSHGAYIFLFKNGEIQNVSVLFDGNHIWSGNPPQYPDGGVMVWYKIGGGSNNTLPNGTLLPNANGEDVRIGIQISTSLSPTQSDPIVFKPMICTASDYAISPAFVPYAPTNRQLYELIKQYHP